MVALGAALCGPSRAAVRWALLRRSRRVGVLWGEDLSFFAVLARLVRWRERRREGQWFEAPLLARHCLLGTIPFDAVSKQNPN
jgi:hypothetical protein